MAEPIRKKSLFGQGLEKRTLDFRVAPAKYQPWLQLRLHFLQENESNQFQEKDLRKLLWMNSEQVVDPLELVVEAPLVSIGQDEAQSVLDLQVEVDFYQLAAHLHIRVVWTVLEYFLDEPEVFSFPQHIREVLHFVVELRKGLHLTTELGH